MKGMEGREKEKKSTYVVGMGVINLKSRWKNASLCILYLCGLSLRAMTE
jgi:hypothetical protein